MTSFFGEPQTAAQWLLRSVCWTIVAVGGWLTVSVMVLEVPYDQKTPDEPLVFVSFVVAHILVWWRAIPGLNTASAQESGWLEMIAFTWQITLIAFQMISLGLMLLMLASPLFYDPFSSELNS